MTIPRATYRLQLHKNFTLSSATALVPYLDALGIDTLYLSPIFTARIGSQHGYDVTDPTHVNPELGGMPALRELLDVLQAHQMGVILDVVPNHMAADPHNRWWWDVLELGPASSHAQMFDIDWTSKIPGHPQILLPFMGHPFGQELEAGTLILEQGPEGFYVRYYDKRFPLTPRSWRPILARTLHRLYRIGQRRAHRELYRLWHRLTPSHNSWTRTPGHDLQRWMQRYPLSASQITGVLATYGGTVGDSQSWNRLERLLAMQWWRLEDFRTASEEGNYRRFFDINELPAVRVESSPVFEMVHKTLLDLCQHQAVYGVRIDHIDGLFDPEAYLFTLLSRLPEDREPYLVVEKILGPRETLPSHWPTAGTTGYDFLNASMEVFLDPRGLERLRTIYGQWHPDSEPDAMEREGKHQVLHELFSAELTRLTRALVPIAAQDRWGHDLTNDQIRHAIAALTLCVPIYRTYLRSSLALPSDRKVLVEALQKARTLTPELPETVWTFMHRVLFFMDAPPMPARKRQKCQEWVMRWQQLTGPVHAKGLEDTTLYRYHRLICLNEVGGNLDSYGLSPEQFHEHMQRRCQSSPHTLNATSTHDTKRSEDVRARLGILSEIPDLWEKTVTRLREHGKTYTTRQGPHLIPDMPTQYLIFQSLIGAWPNDPNDLLELATRLKSYLQKAAREAKIFSRWDNPNHHYEDGLFQFVDGLLQDQDFKTTIQPLVDLTSFYGALNAVSQALLKATVPGVPDFYQGSELWNLSLTDPDNRRPIDFGRRQTILMNLANSSPSPSDLLDHWTDGRFKLHVTHQTLRVRRQHPELFANGSYHGLLVDGPQSRHVLAFVRRWKTQWCLIAVPRFYVQLTWDEDTNTFNPDPAIWDDTMVRLPDGAPAHWVDAFTGKPVQATAGRLPMAYLLSPYPVALLLSDTAKS